jgi:hypothetical protein
MTLTSVLSIQPGITKKNEVLSILGPPNEKREYSLSRKTRNFEWWSYGEGAYKAIDRVSVDFPLDSDVVLAVGWSVKSNEPESLLEAAESHFPTAKFEVEPVPDVNPHASENALYYKDKQRGILIRYNEVFSRVESISWMLPEELDKRTSIDLIEYPEFCLQGHCAKSSPKIQRALTGQ